MKTEISRSSYKPEENYSGVYQQQGRMLTDSDWNELVDILKHRLNDALADVIGSGAPKNGGVELLQDGHIVPGTVYVDGVIAHITSSDPDIPIEAQPDFPGAPGLDGSECTIYLDVWDRTVGALEESSLRDPALKVFDTTTRTRTMAQVKWCRNDKDPENPDHNPSRGNAKVTLVLRKQALADDPCDPCAVSTDIDAEIGNYLFRVEAHDVEGDPANPDRFTLKWSSENGAEQAALVASDGSAIEPPTSFKGGKFCYEYFDEVSEAHLGNHLHDSGTFRPARHPLSGTYDVPGSAPNKYVRRWDGYCVLTNNGDGTWSLLEGIDRGVDLSDSSAIDALGHVETTVPDQISLVLDSMNVVIETGAFVAGDYWLKEIRRDRDSLGDTVLDASLPAGIEHHYLKIAESDSEGRVEMVGGRVCKQNNFPPLTDLWADDVCYDNTGCDDSNARNVQEALDELCRHSNLKFHNKHLHGYGIVCGLQVECGLPVGDDDGREHVNVQAGNAIDRNGNHFQLDHGVRIDIVDRVTAMIEAGRSDLLDENGDGDFSLVIEDGPDEPVIDIEKYEPGSDAFSEILKGTLLQDIFDDCIMELVDDLRQEFTKPEDQDGISDESDHRWIALVNLLVQFDSQNDNGKKVFLSEAEHLLLDKLFGRLKGYLASKTYCALYDDITFPDYPEDLKGRDTVFGCWTDGQPHNRLRVHQPSKRGYTIGEDNRIYVYALDENKHLKTLEFPGNREVRVTDVAIDAAGEVLYASAIVDDKTILATAQIAGDGYTWGQVKVICNHQLVTLLFYGEELFAVSLGKGLYKFDFEQSEESLLVEVHVCEAVGHLDISEFRGEKGAVLTAGPRYAEGIYNAVELVSFSDPTKSGTAPLGQASQVEGEDDIKLVLDDSNGVGMLFVVAGLSGSNNKFLLGHNLNPMLPGSEAGGPGTAAPAAGAAAAGGPGTAAPATNPEATVYTVAPMVEIEPGLPLFIPMAQLEDTRIRLEGIGGYLCISLEYSHRLQLFDLRTLNRFVPRGELLQPTIKRHPVQIAPLDLTTVEFDDGSQHLFVLNSVSDTLTHIPNGSFVLDAEDGSNTLVESLVNYRNAVLMTALSLSQGLLQYLKDCFCHHLLIKCPDYDDSDKLYLGSVSIRGHKVEKICNFSKRKYVKSFPTIGYWLSILPIANIFDWLLTKVCCLVIPPIDEWGKNLNFRMPAARTQNMASGYQAGGWTTQSLKVARTGSWKPTFMMERNNLADIGGGIVQQVWDNMNRVSVGQTLNQQDSLINVRDRAAQTQVQELDQKIRQADAATDRMEQVRTQLESVTTPDISAVNEALATAEASKVSLTADIAQLNADADAVQSSIETASASINQLETRVSEVAATDSISAEVTALEARKQTLLTEIQGMETTLGTLDGAIAAKSAELTTLNATVGQMATDIVEYQAQIDKAYADMQFNISKIEPVTAVTGIGDVTANTLRTAGINTVGDLAAADRTVLMGAGLSGAQADAFIAGALTKLGR